MLERLVLKNAVDCTSQDLKRTSGVRVIFFCVYLLLEIVHVALYLRDMNLLLLLVVGCWLLVVGRWLLVVGCWLLLVVGRWSFVDGCWLLVVGCWSPVAFSARCLLFVCLFVGCCPVSVACCLLLVV